MKISDAINKRSNNLNLLKFVAALLVIYSHACSVCGYAEREILQVILGGKTVVRWRFCRNFFVL